MIIWAYTCLPKLKIYCTIITMTAFIPNISNKEKGGLMDAIFRIITLNSGVKNYFEPIIQQFNPIWKADGHVAKVVNIHHHSANTYSLHIQPSDKWPGFERPGNHVRITLMKDGAWQSRYFSISSSPGYFERTGLIQLTIRQQSPTGMTSFMKETLEVGDKVSISAAQGDFYLPTNSPNETSNRHPIVMVAGGSGITPFRSMLQQLVLQQSSTELTNPHTPAPSITLLYFANPNEHLFETELKAMANMGLIRVHFLVAENHGFMNKELLNQYAPETPHAQHYICGPKELMATTQRVLREQSIHEENIHMEFFGPSLMPAIEGERNSYPIHFESQAEPINSSPTKSLLELAEEHDLNAVRGCGMGVCHQCICKKKQGVVRNIKTGELSENGEGWIQLCISQAASPLQIEL